MKEILSAKCSKTFSKSVNAKHRHGFKLAILFRCIIFFSVIFIYYTKFILTTNTELQHKAAKISGATKYGRKILNLPVLESNTSKIYESNDFDGKDNTTLQPLITNCTPPSILEFPSDGFTREQRQHGWIVLHILTAFYCFWLLAIICYDYLLPAIDQICSTLGIQVDVVGATIMAAATSSSELFMNCVGTFVTRGDIGISTIVGSSVFNILAVPACCGFFVGQQVCLDWWPVTRDCFCYCVTVLALIATLYDGKVMWYEALCLFIAYFFYMAIMYYNDKMARSARKLISKYRRKLRGLRSYREVSEFTPILSSCSDARHSKASTFNETYSSINQLETGVLITTTTTANSISSLSSNENDYADSPWLYIGHCSYEFVLRWPITVLLWFTLPDSRKHPSCMYITFLLSIAWTGVISYLIAYVITIIGDTLYIPDSVMGLTILSAGMSVPEAVSSIIVTKQGHGAMGISNAIGSNTFDILLCLGLPWLIKAYFLPDVPGELWVTLNSSGFTYSIVFMLSTLFGLYIAFLCNRFVLDWKIGLTCTIMFVAFLATATLIELNVFFPVNLPICEQN